MFYFVVFFILIGFQQLILLILLIQLKNKMKNNKEVEVQEKSCTCNFLKNCRCSFFKTLQNPSETNL